MSHLIIAGGEGKILNAPVTTDLVDTIRNTTSVFSRASTASLIDFQPLMKYAIAEEARFEGALRKHNLFMFSKDFTDPIWVTTGTGLATSPTTVSLPNENDVIRQGIFPGELDVGDVYTVRVLLSGSGTMKLQLQEVVGGSSGQTNLDITLSASPTIYSVSHTVTDGDNTAMLLVFKRAVGDTALGFTGEETQLQSVTGQTDQNPDGFVSSDVLSLPFHGANVDAVEYSNIQNGNTVDGSGVLTELSGPDIAQDTLQGILLEIARTQLILSSNDLTDPVWSKIDGAIATKNTLTFVNATSHLRQVMSGVNTTGIFTISFKVSGTPQNVEFELVDNSDGSDSHITTIAITEIPTEYDIIGDFSSSATFSGNLGFYINRIGTVIAGSTLNLEIVQTEEGAFATSYVPSTTSTVTRAADNLDYELGAGKFPQQFTLLVELRLVADGVDYAAAEFRVFGTDDSRGSNNEIRTSGSVAYGFSYLAGGGGFFFLKRSDFTKDTKTKLGFSLSQEGGNIRAIIIKDGVVVYNALTVGTLDHSNLGTLQVGRYNTSSLSSNYKNICLLKRILTTQQIQENITEFITDELGNFLVDEFGNRLFTYV